MSRLAFAGLCVLSLAVACGAITAQPLSSAPLNAGCPEQHACDLYVVADATETSPKAQFTEAV